MFGTPLFEASKLDVIFLGMSVDEHPEILPRIYTLTHCDITAMLTLTISQSINKTQVQHNFSCNNYIAPFAIIAPGMF